MLVPWYLMASYAYYHLDDPILTDVTFDDICVRLQRDWDKVQHPHKYLIERNALSAGTCFLPAEQFPAMVVGAVHDVLSGNQGLK